MDIPPLSTSALTHFHFHYLLLSLRQKVLAESIFSLASNKPMRLSEDGQSVSDYGLPERGLWVLGMAVISAKLDDDHANQYKLVNISLNQCIIL